MLGCKLALLVGAVEDDQREQSSPLVIHCHPPFSPVPAFPSSPASLHVPVDRNIPIERLVL